MTIQIDSREKAKAITKILSEFDRQDVTYYISKLYVGDYMSLDNPRLIVDRKQNLSEVCHNICQDHVRFRDECIRAKEAGIKLVILVEHGKGINRLEDVIWWENPRSIKRVQEPSGKWVNIPTKAMTGDQLYKRMVTMENKYGIEFKFCAKNDTGKKIIEILGGDVCDN